jgi:hypothetical protein
LGARPRTRLSWVGSAVCGGCEASALGRRGAWGEGRGMAGGSEHGHGHGQPGRGAGRREAMQSVARERGGASESGVRVSELRRFLAAQGRGGARGMERATGTGRRRLSSTSTSHCLRPRLPGAREGGGSRSHSRQSILCRDVTWQRAGVNGQRLSGAEAAEPVVLWYIPVLVAISIQRARAETAGGGV